MLYFCYLKIRTDSQEKQQQQKRSKLDPFYFAFLFFKKQNKQKKQIETPSPLWIFANLETWASVSEK